MDTVLFIDRFIVQCEPTNLLLSCRNVDFHNMNMSISVSTHNQVLKKC